MLHSIKTADDINNFLDKTNSLHDGYILGVTYTNDGISKIEDDHYFEPEKRRLILRILVTSICDTVVEMEFENPLEWQIKGHPWEITDISVFFNQQNLLVWMDDIYTSAEEMEKSSYIIAESMKWRIVE